MSSLGKWFALVISLRSEQRGTPIPFPQQHKVCNNITKCLSRLYLISIPIVRLFTRWTGRFFCTDFFSKFISWTIIFQRACIFRTTPRDSVRNVTGLFFRTLNQNILVCHLYWMCFPRRRLGCPSSNTEFRPCKLYPWFSSVVLNYNLYTSWPP